MVRLKEYENIYSLDLEKEETHEEEDFVHSFVPSELASWSIFRNVWSTIFGQRREKQYDRRNMTKLFNRNSIRRREFCSLQIE